MPGVDWRGKKMHEEKIVIRSVSGLVALLALAGCGTTPMSTAAPVTLVAPAVLTAETCRSINGRADSRCTPGAINPAVTQDNIHSTICVPEWTDKVQPAADYTAALKLRQMRDFGETGSPQNYKEDHLIPLSLGGAPTDPKNLFPQPAAKTTEKEELEDHLHQSVCSGQMTLTAAQAQMRHDWAR
jgi:hypothetical protein